MQDKKPNYILWALIVSVVYLSMQKTDRKPLKPVSATVSETLPNIRAAYRKAFLDAAKRIESKEIKTSQEWTAFIKSNAGVKQKEAMDAVYAAIDALGIPDSFAGREKEIADLNREIGNAW